MNTKEMIVPVRGRQMSKRGILNALFYGVPGTGKTTIAKDYINEIKAKNDNYMSAAINNNAYTSSFELQKIMMS